MIPEHNPSAICLFSNMQCSLRCRLVTSYALLLRTAQKSKFSNHLRFCTRFYQLTLSSGMIYSFYLFDRHCNCIYSREWSYKGEGSVNKSNDSDAAKLLFGLVYSLKNISTKLGSSAGTVNLLKSFATQNYRIHLYETASGLRFCLISDVGLDNLQLVLHKLYTDIYLRTVVYNSLSPIDFKPGEKISNSNFIIEVDSLIQGLSAFE